MVAGLFVVVILHQSLHLVTGKENSAPLAFVQVRTFWLTWKNFWFQITLLNGFSLLPFPSQVGIHPSFRNRVLAVSEGDLGDSWLAAYLLTFSEEAELSQESL